MSGPIIGIDLGTTFSLVSVLRDGVPVILPNALGELLTPSAVAVDEQGRVLVGAAAKARATIDPARTALAFKRDMGTSKVFRLGEKDFTAPELSALVLSALRADAEAALGTKVEEAVVTVPAYFADAQRQATRDAGAIAGLKVERIINEPTAAALAYGLHQRDREFRAIVLDLGGGTFDVTVLEIIEGVIEIQASAGDARLGGEDFDDALAARLGERLAREFSVDAKRDARTIARVRDAAELAKRRLSADTEARIALVGMPGSDGSVDGRRSGSVAPLIDVEMKITRVEAEEAWAATLARLDAPVRRALHDASLRASDVDEVLLVGGSTRMACVSQFAARTFGRVPLRALPPDEAVAMGAAVQAALKSRDAAVEDVVVTDIAPFTLGIETTSAISGQRVNGLFSPILERGTVIPASRSRVFSTVEPMQKQLKVRVFQGEHSVCSANAFLGEYVVATPPTAEPQGVDVRFTYDLNGILEVETKVLSTGKVSALVVERAPGRLSKKEIENARKEMSRLKLHPRDALPNTALLARAEALHQELTGAPRAMLAEAMTLFRATLEAQDPSHVTEARIRLDALVKGLGSSR